MTTRYYAARLARLTAGASALGLDSLSVVWNVRQRWPSRVRSITTQAQSEECRVTVDIDRRLLGRFLELHPHALVALARNEISILGRFDQVVGFLALVGHAAGLWGTTTARFPRQQGSGFPTELRANVPDQTLLVAIVLAQMEGRSRRVAVTALTGESALSKRQCTRLLVSLGDLAVGRTNHVELRDDDDSLQPENRRVSRRHLAIAIAGLARGGDDDSDDEFAMWASRNRLE